MSKLFTRDWETEWVHYYQKNRGGIGVFLTAFVIQILVYGQKLAYHSLATDDYVRFYSGSEVQAAWNGRWLNEILSGSVFGGPVHILPYWNILLGIFFITWTAYLSSKFFSLNTFFSRVGFILLCTISPFWAENYLFSTNLPVWLFNGIGVYGFYLVVMRGEKKIHWLIGWVLITAAISVYQVVLLLCLVLLFFKVYFEFEEARDGKEIFIAIRKNLLYVIFLGFCFVITTRINSIYLHYMYPETPMTLTSQYGGIFEFLSFSTLWGRILSTYVSVTAFLSPYYFDLIASGNSAIYQAQNFFHYGRFPYLFVYLILFLIVLFFVFIKMVLNVVKSQGKDGGFKLSAICLLFASLPLIINLPALGGAVMPVRGYYPLGWVLAGFWVFSLRQQVVYKNLFILGMLGMLIFSTYYINVHFYWAYRKTAFDTRMANQIVTGIRNHPEYLDEEIPLQFKIIGSKKFVYSGSDWGAQYQAFANGNTQYPLFKHFTDFNFEIMGEESYRQVVKELVIQGEKIHPYPSRNSIYVKGRKVVLFLQADKINRKIEENTSR